MSPAQTFPNSTVSNISCKYKALFFRNSILQFFKTAKFLEDAVKSRSYAGLYSIGETRRFAIY